MTDPANTITGRTTYIIVTIAVILTFFAAYGFAMSRSADPERAEVKLTPVASVESSAAG